MISLKFESSQQTAEINTKQSLFTQPKYSFKLIYSRMKIIVSFLFMLVMYGKSVEGFQRFTVPKVFNSGIARTINSQIYIGIVDYLFYKTVLIVATTVGLDSVEEEGHESSPLLEGKHKCHFS